MRKMSPLIGHLLINCSEYIFRFIYFLFKSIFKGTFYFLTRNETLDDLMTEHNHAEVVLLFVGPDNDDDDSWSKGFILDSSSNPNTPSIRIVGSNRQDLISQFKIKSFPALVHCKSKEKELQDQKTFEVHYVEPSRHKLGELLSTMWKVEPKEVSDSIPAIIEDKPAGAGALTVRRGADQVFMVDLEKSILYSLGHEVAMQGMISGTKLTALKDYINLLDLYFPARRKIKEVLFSIKTKLGRNNHPVSGEKFAEMWKSSVESIYPNWKKEAEDWVGCRGSQSHLRGFPCSLWTLFHTLTVNYALLQPTGNPTKVLTVMKGYIQHFFGCSYCAQHFVEMSENKKKPLTAVESPTDAILWLWSAHNEVNARIAEDQSEDPEFPKIQFPFVDNCVTCWKNNAFDEETVLSYLIKIYQPENISSNGFKEITRNPSDSATSGSGRVAAVQLSTLSFTNYDLSLCAVIYLVSAIMLIWVLYGMILRRRSVRKFVNNIFV